MLPRFLVVSKYELKQYQKSIVDEAIIFLVLLTGFMMLVTPEVEQSQLPSSHKIYRVGYPDPSILNGIDAYTIDFIPYTDQYDMMSAASINDIDAFTILGRDQIVAFGSGYPKSEPALTHLNIVLSDFNSNLIYQQIEKNPILSGVLLPIRIQVIEDEINYNAVINGSLDTRRKDLLGTFRKNEMDEVDQISLSDGQISTKSLQAELDEKAKSEVESPNPSGSSSGELMLPMALNVEFPFKTLYKNMTLLSPLILLSILLSLSLSRERVGRNIENLFQSPLSNHQILLGKSFPYLSIMFVLSLSYGFIFSSGFDAIKIFLVFATISTTLISFSLFSVLISRTYRELTFIGSFSLFGFFFFIVLPNVFSGINVLAFISPLDTITSIENGADIPLMDIMLSILPYSFLCAFFLSFTGLCFNPEVLSSSRDFSSLMSIFYTQLSKTLKNPYTYAFLAVALLVPFLFIIESIMAYLVLPMGFAAPIISVILLATVEELVKIIPFYYRRMNPLVYGVIAGCSFFITEKLFNIYLIVKVYQFLGGPYLYFFKKLLPTAFVHILSTIIFAYIISRRRHPIMLVLGLMLSVTIHVGYNLLVLGGII